MQHPNHGQVATPRLRPSRALTNPASGGAGGPPASANGSPIPSASATGIGFPPVGRSCASTQSEHPPFSIAALGKRLGAFSHESHLLNVLALKLRREVPDGALDARRLAQRHAASAREAVEEHCAALEDLILRSRAETPADAVVQIMVVGAQLEGIRNNVTERDRDRAQRAAEAGLQSALRVLAPALSVALADVGGVYYESAWCDRWPAVSTAGVQSDTDPDHPEAAIDGSVWA